MVRTDIPLAQQLVQACHAAWHMSPEAKSGFEHPSIVLCRASSEKDLLRAQSLLERHAIDYHLFREPDIGNQATALATDIIEDEDEQRIFRRWTCWAPP